MERLITLGRLVVVLAAVWAAAASLYLFFAPITVHEVTATTVAGGRSMVEEITLEKSWYEVQGLWGTLVLLFFAGLYAWACRLAWRAAYLGLALLSGLALGLSYLAGLSVGLVYLPAALTLLTGTFLLGLSRLVYR